MATGTDKTATRKAKAPAAPAPPAEGFEILVEAQAKAAEIWLTSWGRFASESAGFVTRRWQRDLELVEKIWACKTPAELLTLQSEFLQRALCDYMREAGKLADLETDAGVAEIEALDAALRKAGKA